MRSAKTAKFIINMRHARLKAKLNLMTNVVPDTRQSSTLLTQMLQNRLVAVGVMLFISRVCCSGTVIVVPLLRRSYIAAVLVGFSVFDGDRFVCPHHREHRRSSCEGV